MLKALQSREGKVSVKMLVVVAIIDLSAIFLLQNSAVVDIEFLFWKLSMSRVLLLLGSIAAGVVAGFFIGWEVFSKRGRG